MKEKLNKIDKRKKMVMEIKTKNLKGNIDRNKRIKANKNAIM